MKKVIIAAAVIIVAALATLTVSSKSTITKHAETNKIEKTEIAGNSFSTQKNDISSAD